MSEPGQLLASTLPIEVRRSVAQTASAILGCVLFAAVGAWILATNHEPLSLVEGTLTAAAFGLGGLGLLVMLFDNRPRIRLDQGGLWVRGWGRGTIAWTDIKRAWKYEQRVPTRFGRTEVDYVCVAVKDASRYQTRLGTIAKWAVSHGRCRAMGDICFSTRFMDSDADSLVAAIQSHIGGAHLSAVDRLLKR